MGVDVRSRPKYWLRFQFSYCTCQGLLACLPVRVPAWSCACLGTLLGVDAPWGGFSVILRGDPAQLPPVGPRAAFFGLLRRCVPTHADRRRKEADPAAVTSVPSLSTTMLENAGLVIFLPFWSGSKNSRS